MLNDSGALIKFDLLYRKGFQENMRPAFLK